MALEIGAKAYNECSALMNEGVDDVFEKATRLSMLSRAEGEVKPTRSAARRQSAANDDRSSGCGCVVV